MNQSLRIAMFTNTFTPHVGGVARSVESFATELRRRGHRVLVVAPEFRNQPDCELDVLRVPAIQNFNGSDFSVVVSTPSDVQDLLIDFSPQLIHSHHPFLLGNEAARVARMLEVPLVLTHHTLYEQYTHYVPADSALLRTFAAELATCYANMCDRVLAPSESVAGLLQSRGVMVPITVIPTGVDYPLFSTAEGAKFRERRQIPADAFVVGHVGRLAVEKNLEFLSDSILKFLQESVTSFFLLVGDGPLREPIRAQFEAAGLGSRLISIGQLEHDALRHAYAGMDVFAFASHSETQGMVLTEAMATGTPVVAVEANGVREVVSDGRNGRKIPDDDTEAFMEALRWIEGQDKNARRELRQRARETALTYSLTPCADRLLSVYGELIVNNGRMEKNPDPWTRAMNKIAAEWEILSTGAQAFGAAAAEVLTEQELTPGTELVRDRQH
jgi:glycosyltransferase involved in cell wall biosynthesis